MTRNDDVRVTSLELLHHPDDTKNDNVDFELTLTNGETWAGTLFTIKNIEEIMRRHSTTGESAFGLYFWCKDMLIVRDLSQETLRKTMHDLVATNEHAQALTMIRSEEDQ